MSCRHEATPGLCELSDRRLCRHCHEELAADTRYTWKEFYALPQEDQKSLREAALARQKRRDEGRQAVDLWERTFGPIGTRAEREGAILAFRRLHPTHQQTLVGVMLDLLEDLATQKRCGQDPRNEAAVATARRIREHLGPHGMKLPFL